MKHFVNYKYIYLCYMHLLTVKLLIAGSRQAHVVRFNESTTRNNSLCKRLTTYFFTDISYESYYFCNTFYCNNSLVCLCATANLCRETGSSFRTIVETNEVNVIPALLSFIYLFFRMLCSPSTAFVVVICTLQMCCLWKYTHL